MDEALRQLPGADFIYFADTFHVPYGCRPKEQVKKLVLDVSDFLYRQKIDALVVACNTATSIGIQELRAVYDIPVIGMEPAVKVALQKDCHRKVLVFATALTIAEKKYRDLISSQQLDLQVVSLAMPGLVTFAEQADFDSPDVYSYLQQSLASFDLSEFGTLVLGCTHFIYFKNLLADMLPSQISIVDGNAGTVRHLYNTIQDRLDVRFNNNVSDRRAEVHFFTSTSNGPRQTDFTYYLEYLARQRQS